MIKMKVKSPVARFLAKAIPESGKTMSEIAVALGYSPIRANYISMIRTGQAKLPVNKVRAMADAINVDPVYLLRLTLQEYAPETYKVIEEVLHLRGSMLTAGEQQLVDLVRKEAHDLNLEFESQDLERVRVVVKDVAARERKDVNKQRKFNKSTRAWDGTKLQPA